MAEKPLRSGAYFDTDSDGDWLDLPESRYGPNREPLRQTAKESRQRLDPEWRKQHGLTPLPPLSPDITDH